MPNDYSPNPVQHYHDYLQRGLPPKAFVKFRRAYIRNISYSLQYLEYLDHVVNGEYVHSIIRNQSQKTFIVTGCSIIESMLWMLIKDANLQSKIEWVELQNRVTNSFLDEGVEHRFEVHHLRRRQKPVDAEMKFIEMCRRAEKKKLLGLTSDAYSQLNHLRKLRNRVHIHSVQHDRDNDWWKISNSDYTLMKSVLKSFLRSEIFEPYPEYDRLFFWFKSE